MSRVATNAGIGLGGALGGLLAARGLPGFVLLFLANAITYLIYVAVLVAVVHEPPRPERSACGYRHVLRDGAFLRLAAANLAVIAVGWGTFTWLLPPFAVSTIGLPTGPIGLLLAANAVTVVLVQVPVARLAEGRRRVRMMALATGVFTVASLVVIAAGAVPPGPAYGLLLAVCVAVGAGECFYTATLMPLTADLAPEGLRGRYMAALGFSWWAGPGHRAGPGRPAAQPVTGGRVRGGRSGQRGRRRRAAPAGTEAPGRGLAHPAPRQPKRPGPNRVVTRRRQARHGRGGAGPGKAGRRSAAVSGCRAALGAELRDDRVHGDQWCPNQARAGGRSRRSKISE